MPSENKTANIGLNQWRANEYPKREDFNADNLTIDEALDGKLSKTGDGKDVTVTFDEATTRTNIGTGEKLLVMLGKIKKWFSDLKTVAFTGSYVNLDDKPNDENLDICEDTKTALGLTQPEPKVKDAFAKLSEIYLYWWEKRTLGSYTKRIDGDYFEKHLENENVFFSSSVTVSSTNIILNNPTEIPVNYDHYTNANKLKGKYFKIGNNKDDTPVYLGGSKDARREYTSSYPVFFNATRVYTYFTPGTILGFISSTNPNAYTEGENPDGYNYRALGQPFVNARMGSKIEIGSYTGTGTYGSDNPNSLTFGFEPYFIAFFNESGNLSLISSNKPWDDGRQLAGLVTMLTTSYKEAAFPYSHHDNSRHYYSHSKMSEDRKTLYWYSSYSSGYQYNSNGDVYYYLAIG